MSDSLQPYGLYSPWNSLGQNTGVGSLFESLLMARDTQRLLASQKEWSRFLLVCTSESLRSTVGWSLDWEKEGTCDWSPADDRNFDFLVVSSFTFRTLLRHLFFYLCVHEVLFFKGFFWCGPFFKVFIEFVIILLLFYVLSFWPWGMWDLSSLTRSKPTLPALEGEILTLDCLEVPMCEMLAVHLVCKEIQPDHTREDQTSPHLCLSR